MRLDELSINTIRFLSADAVEYANSGHPGTPMGAAPIMYILWKKFLRHSPNHPKWINRDRFILSSGHASMMLYSMLYLTGYDLSLDDIKNFRKMGSITPGHPEVNLTPGVEMTTGPLGQGFATGVGFAIAEKHLGGLFNKPGFSPIIDHFTYVFASDGDLMEGVSAEAASLAGHLQLGKLIVLYDDNHVSLDGSTELAFTEDRLMRFTAYGWHTLYVDDANDLGKIAQAIQNAREESNRPSIIAVRSILGYGAPNKQGKSIAHAGALGELELSSAKVNLGWPTEEKFFVPEEVLADLRGAKKVGDELVFDWTESFRDYAECFPDAAKDFDRMAKGTLPADWESHLPTFDANPDGKATRFANGYIVNALAPILPELMGGAADVAPALMTLIEDSQDFGPEASCGRNLRFGVREHAMGAILNGLALHGGIIPYGATFLAFYDYMRPSVRLAALMKIRIIVLFSHDSIGLGEDGPTHQPIEQLMGLRSVPNLVMIRPCDLNETVEAWRMAVRITDSPVCIALSRQKVPVLDRNKYAPASNLKYGAYVLSDAYNGRPNVILIATGSEVHLALASQDVLQEEGIPCRVVSMPSSEIFQMQTKEYRNHVLNPLIKARVAIEAGTTLGWERWVGFDGAVIGIDKFGESAPGEQLMEKYGFTIQNVVETVHKLLQHSPR